MKATLAESEWSDFQRQKIQEALADNPGWALTSGLHLTYAGAHRRYTRLRHQGFEVVISSIWAHGGQSYIVLVNAAL